MQALDVGAVLALALHHHAVNLTEAVEVGAVKSAVVALQRGKDCFGRNAGALTLCCVDVDKILREVRAEVRLRRLNLGALFKVCEEGLCHVKELVEVAAGTVLQVERETVGCAVTRHHRRLEEEHLRVLKHFAGAEVEVGKHNGRAFRHAALFPLFKFDDKRAVGRTLASDKAVARNHGADLYARHRAHEAIHAAHIGIGAVLRRTGRHRHDTHNRTRVFVGHHCRRRDRHQPNEQGDKAARDAEREHAVLDKVEHGFFILLQYAVVGLVEFLLERLGAEAYHCRHGDNRHDGGDNGMAREVEAAENHAEDSDDNQHENDAGLHDAAKCALIAFHVGFGCGLVGSAEAFLQGSLFLLLMRFEQNGAEGGGEG